MLLSSVNITQSQLVPKVVSAVRTPMVLGDVLRMPVASRPFLSAADFLKMTASYKMKVAGKLPQEFRTLFKGNLKKAFEFFDELAKLSRGHIFFSSHDKMKSKIAYPNVLPKKFEMDSSSGQKIKVEYVGSGAYGKVFRIDAGEKSFAFKAFHGGERPDVGHGPVSEIRTDTVLSGEDYCNKSKFYIGNFEQQWSLSEYIDASKDSAAKRPGIRVEDARHDLAFGDPHGTGGGNTINGIRVDPGGITPWMPGAKDIPALPAMFINCLRQEKPAFNKIFGGEILGGIKGPKDKELVDKFLINNDKNQERKMMKKIWA